MSRSALLDQIQKGKKLKKLNKTQINDRSSPITSLKAEGGSRAGGSGSGLPEDMTDKKATFGDKTLDNYKSVNNQYGYEEQSATSLANHLAMTQALYDKIDGEIYKYKQMVNELRQSINNMKNKVLAANEETVNTLNPFIHSLNQSLNLQINTQKEENSKLQNQISELKKEKSQIQQLIVASLQKTAAIEEEVGSYT